MRKRKYRQTTARPHRLHTALMPAQETITVELWRTYLFVAIARATRWVYARSYANQSQTSSTTSCAGCTPPRR